MKKKYKRGERRALIGLINSKQAEIEGLEKKIEEIKNRFRALGSEVETIDTDVGTVRIIRAEVKRYGKYRENVDPFYAEQEIYEIANQIAKGLIENDIAQLLWKGNDADGPLSMFSTIAAKLYVIPWEQMRSRAIEIRTLE